MTAILRLVFINFAVWTAAFPVAALAEMKTLNGTVTYRERMALPPAASIEVKLVDVSLADAPSTTIAETTFVPEGQVPVPYVLHYEDTAIQPNRRYALQARISAEGRLLFITATHHPIFTGGVDETDIVVERVASTASPTGRWLAEDIRGGGVIDNLQTVLEIAEDGAISGSGGCNRMVGKATISGDSIAFGAIGATRMACPPASMDQEAKFFAALEAARAWRIDEARAKLTLLDEAGNALVVLARM